MAGMVLTRCVSRTLLSASGAKAIRIRGNNRHYRTTSGKTATAGTVSNDACQPYSSCNVCCPAWNCEDCSPTPTDRCPNSWNFNWKNWAPLWKPLFCIKVKGQQGFELLSSECSFVSECNNRSVLTHCVKSVLELPPFSFIHFLCCAQAGGAAFLLGLPALSCLAYEAYRRVQSSAVVQALEKGRWRLCWMWDTVQIKDFWPRWERAAQYVTVWDEIWVNLVCVSVCACVCRGGSGAGWLPVQLCRDGEAVPAAAAVQGQVRREITHTAAMTNCLYSFYCSH